MRCQGQASQPRLFHADPFDLAPGAATTAVFIGRLVKRDTCSWIKQFRREIQQRATEDQECLFLVIDPLQFLWEHLIIPYCLPLQINHLAQPLDAQQIREHGTKPALIRGMLIS
ncbi:hypothetical protein N7512_009762 [Penicillium capsulatum]|nr:hypothetical protein N7512_009762 [Penicillium capsulatum]